MKTLLGIISNAAVTTFVVALIVVIVMPTGFCWLLWPALLIAVGVITAELYVVLSKKRKGNENNNT